MNPFIDIIEEHVTEITYLWELRSTAIMQPQHTVETLKKLEQRIENHINGLVDFIDDAWNFCEQAMEFDDAGALFVMTVVAITKAEPSKIKIAFDAGIANKKTLKGLTSALGWLPSKVSGGWIKRLLDSNNKEYQHLAIAACSVRRLNPKGYLNNILTDKNSLSYQNLYTRALRLAGELKRMDLLPIIQQASKLNDPDIVFWANWSSLLLGDRSAAINLKPTVLASGANQRQAIDAVFRVLAIHDARQWISELANDPDNIRETITAIAILGDPHPIDWLISKMKTASVARLAGEAFSTITGIDLDENALTDTSPQVHESRGKSLAQGDDILDDVDELNMDDENLAWPDAIKVTSFWEQKKSRFNTGQRYFLGLPIVTQHLENTINFGRQRHRHAAALELALLQTANPYINTQARVLD